MKKETDFKSIEDIANEFQVLESKKKSLEIQIKPLKQMLTGYVKSHRSNLDEDFRYYFKNGSYVLLKVADVLNGSKEDLKLFRDAIDDPAFKIVKLDAKRIVESAKADKKLAKLLTAHKISPAQRETWALYSK